jgi:integrase
MVAKENFTVGRIRTFKCEPGKQQTIYWDGTVPGLGLRVTCSGARTFIFEARLHSKTFRHSIGDPRVWNIVKAKAEATRLKTLTDQGIDPRELTAKQVAEAHAKQSAATAMLEEDLRLKVTMATAWSSYIEARKHKWCAQYTQDHRYAITGKDTPAPLASLSSLLLIELTSERVCGLLREEVKRRPTAAYVAFRKLRAFVAWCAGHDTFSRAMHPNCCSTQAVKDELPKQKAKTDCLQCEQLKYWFAEVRRLPPVPAVYLQALLLTGARRSELASLRWTDVDFQWKSLTIKDKVEGSRVIPLTPFVSDLLLNLKQINETRNTLNKNPGDDPTEERKPSEWVFFSPTAASGHIEGPHIAHCKALKNAELPPLSLHGLRRSFKSLTEWVEIPVGVVAQIMGHKPSATAEKHYTVRPLDLLRAWHTKIETWITEQAELSASELVPLKVVGKPDAASNPVAK